MSSDHVSDSPEKESEPMTECVSVMEAVEREDGLTAALAADPALDSPVHQQMQKLPDIESQPVPEEDFDPESVVSEAAFWHVSFFSFAPVLLFCESACG